MAPAVRTVVNSPGSGTTPNAGLSRGAEFDRAGEMVSERELVAVWITDSRCPHSRYSELPNIVQRITAGLQAQATQAGMVLTSVGVALDADVAAGIAHLQAFGPFDEVVVGRGWHNLAAIKFVWDQHPGQASTPQLLVLERAVERSPGLVRIVSEEVQYRKAGAFALESWAAVAFP